MDDSSNRIIQNYYGGNKFDRQKQKHFCAVCKIDIAPSKTSIMFHEQSKTHLDKKKQALDSSYQKRRGGFGGPSGAPMRTGTMPTGPAMNAEVQNELKRIEQAAFDSYDQKDANGFRYKRLTQAQLNPDQPKKQDKFDADLGYSKPKNHGSSDFSFSIDDIRNDPIWSSHYDEDIEEIFYYNRKTKKSVWEKPTDFDGYEIMRGISAKRKDDEYTRTFGGLTKVTQLEPVLQARTVPEDVGHAGGWEEVAEEDYYSKNAVKNLDETKQKEVNSMGEESRAKTYKEIFEPDKQDSPQAEDGNIESEESFEDSVDKAIFKDLQIKQKSAKGNSSTLLGKRRGYQNRAKLITATENDIVREKYKDMKDLVHKGIIDEDCKKEIFEKQEDLPLTTGFKKREVKKAGKGRQPVTEDGERD